MDVFYGPMFSRTQKISLRVNGNFFFFDQRVNGNLKYDIKLLNNLQRDEQKSYRGGVGQHSLLVCVSVVVVEPYMRVKRPLRWWSRRNQNESM